MARVVNEGDAQKAEFGARGIRVVHSKQSRLVQSGESPRMKREPVSGEKNGSGKGTGGCDTTKGGIWHESPTALHDKLMPLVRLGPHVCNPLPSLTQNSRTQSRPLEQACRSFRNGNVPSTATQLTILVATPVPQALRRNWLESIAIRIANSAIL
jgi:hypothetical protein